MKETAKPYYIFAPSLSIKKYYNCSQKIAVESSTRACDFLLIIIVDRTEEAGE
jgi:hypothetical protein